MTAQKLPNSSASVLKTSDGSRDLVSVSRHVSRPVFLSLGLDLGLERLRSRLGLGLERFRSRSRVLGLEVLGLK